MYVEINYKMSLSGLAAHQKQIPMPKMRMDEFRIGSKDFAVVDGATASGENLRGLINKLRLGEGANTPVYVERDEAGILIDCMTPGISTGVIQDPDLAADNDPAVDDSTKRRSLNFRGPFQLRAMNRPTLDIDLLAVTTEWPSASAFSATLNVLVKLSPPAKQLKQGVYWMREYRSTDVRHELNPGESLVKEVFLIAATESARTVPIPYLNKIRLAAKEPGKDKASAANMDIAMDEPYLAEDEYASYKDSAYVPGRYRIHGLRSSYYSKRTLIVEAGTTTTLLMFAKNVVG